MRAVQFNGSTADHYRMQWSQIGHFLYETFMLCLRQGLIYKALVVLLAVCSVIIVHHILHLYLTKAKPLGISAKELARLKHELQEKQEQQKSKRIRY
jgi:hypothetical protein